MSKTFSNRDRAKVYLVAIGLLVMILFFIITNIIWLDIDNSIPQFDPAIHIQGCIKYYAFLTQVHSIFDLRHFFGLSTQYPPFYYLSTIPVIALLGFSHDYFVYVNFFYIILLVLSVFGIGKLLFNEWVGFFSALLTMLYPLVYGLSRLYYIDFALLAMVSLVQYLILKSEGGIKRPWNILLGVATGLTLLTKTHGLIFFLPTWIIVFLMHYRKKDNLKPLIVTLFISFIIAAPWYTAASGGLVDLTKETIIIEKTLPEKQIFFNLISFYNSPLRYFHKLILYSFYNPKLYYELISPVLSFALFLGLILFFIFDARWKTALILTSWIIPSYFALAFWTNKDVRFILPLLPAFAIFTIGGLSRLPLKLLKEIILGSIICVGFIQFNSILLNSPPFLFRRSIYCRSPISEDWKVREIVDCILHYKGLKKISIGVLPMLPYFDRIQFRLHLNELNNNIYRIINIAEDGDEAGLTINEIGGLDILITKTPPLGKPAKKKFYNDFNTIGADKLGFRKIEEFDLPDNTKAILYENVRKR